MKSATGKAPESGPETGRQTIARLTPLAGVLAALAAVRPVAMREIDVRDALHRVLAVDVAAPRRPARASALRDGFAVRAADLADAGGYTPVPLAMPQRVETGDELPDGTDAVATGDAIVLRGASAEALAAVTPGDGVLPAGGDADPAQPLRKAGERLRALDIAALEAAGVTRVSMRAPRLLVVPAREDVRLTPALGLIAREAAQHGADATIRNGVDPEAAFRETGFDAVIMAGGSGHGARDRSVSALRQVGEVVCHGVGLTPGETAAFGRVDRRPVLVVPGRLDAALTVWTVLGRALLRALSAAQDCDATVALTLTRKIASAVGFAEFVPVRCHDGQAEPLAGGFLPLSALTQADGWLLVPADSEGYPAGAAVAVHLWR